MADALLDGIVGWVTGRGSRLRLAVHEHAVPARKFSDRDGFALTGRMRPLTLTEGQTLEMVRVLPAR